MGHQKLKGMAKGSGLMQKQGPGALGPQWTWWWAVGDQVRAETALRPFGCSMCHHCHGPTFPAVGSQLLPSALCCNWTYQLVMGLTVGARAAIIFMCWRLEVELLWLPPSSHHLSQNQSYHQFLMPWAGSRLQEALSESIPGHNVSLTSLA